MPPITRACTRAAISSATSSWAAYPPDQDIGLREHFLGQTVLGLARRRRPQLQLRMSFQRRSQGAMNALRLKAPDLRVGLFLDEFVPDGYADGVHRQWSLYFSGRSLMFLNQQSEPWSCNPMYPVRGWFL